jgi:hypothetical protein
VSFSHGVSLVAGGLFVVFGWYAVYRILCYGPGMFSKDKLVIAFAVALGAILPDVPALVALLDLNPVVSRAVCSALLALAAAYKLTPKVTP